MDTNETTEEGYYLIPKAWLQAIAQKQDRVLSLLENGNIANPNDCIGDYISEDEAKRQLGRKTTWFWSMRTTGQLPFSKTGKRIFYLKSDIKKLIEKNMKGRTQESSPKLSKAA